MLCFFTNFYRYSTYFVWTFHETNVLECLSARGFHHYHVWLQNCLRKLKDKCILAQLFCSFHLPDSIHINCVVLILRAVSFVTFQNVNFQMSNSALRSLIWRQSSCYYTSTELCYLAVCLWITENLRDLAASRMVMWVIWLHVGIACWLPMFQMVCNTEILMLNHKVSVKWNNILCRNGLIQESNWRISCTGSSGGTCSCYDSDGEFVVHGNVIKMLQFVQKLQPSVGPDDINS